MKRFIFLLLFLASVFANDQFELSIYHAGTQAIAGEKRITIITASYNNKEWYKKNLDSIFNQKYSNYRIIYIDDCSSDGTSQLVDDYIKECRPQCDIILVKNKVRVFVPLNAYRAIHMADPTDILVTVDGDDWLAHDQVLSTINQVYTDDNIWLTYGQFLVYPSGSHGFCRAYPRFAVKWGLFRQVDDQPSHLRTCRAWLAQQVRVCDLLYDGVFYPMAGDLAFTMPMIEMADERHKFISDILYIYNEKTLLNEHKVSGELQGRVARDIRSSFPYRRLDCSKQSYRDDMASTQVSAIVFSFDQPNNLCDLLSSMRDYARHIDSYCVLYHASQKDTGKLYRKLKHKFSEIAFVDVVPQNMSEKVRAAVNACKQDYVVTLYSDLVLTAVTDFNECARLLKETGAYSFHLANAAKDAEKLVGVHLGQGIVAKASEDIFAWQMSYVNDLWNDQFRAVLHRKPDIIALLKNCTWNETARTFDYCASKGLAKEVGLCYELAKIFKVGVFPQGVIV